MERCEDCGRRLDRPPYWDCDGPHAKPNLAQRIVDAIEDDLNSRCGMSFAGIDDEIQDQIRDEWERLIWLEFNKDLLTALAAQKAELEASSSAASQVRLPEQPEELALHPPASAS